MTKQLIATISEDITVTGRVQNEVSFFNHVRPFFGIVGLLFLVSAAYGEKLPGADPVFYNTDLPGSNIGPGQPLYPPPPPPPGGISLDLRQEECHDSCASNSACVAWTYVLPTTINGPGVCWLKNAVPAAKSATYSVSGTINEQNTDRPGGDYTHFDTFFGQPITTPPVCKFACENDSACMAWTFVKPGVQEANGVCWLKNTIPPAVNNDNCTSGTMVLYNIQ